MTCEGELTPALRAFMDLARGGTDARRGGRLRYARGNGHLPATMWKKGDALPGGAPIVPIPVGETFEKHIVIQSIRCNTNAFICWNMSTSYPFNACEYIGWGGHISKTKRRG